MRNAGLTVSLMLLLSACEVFNDTAEFEPEYVVESYQVAGEPMKQIRLSRTASVEETYDFNALAVRDADVRVELLSESGGVEASYPFKEDPNWPGIYLPVDPQATLLPLRTYRMEAVLSDVLVRAQTLVPDTFSIRQASADTLLYQGDEQLELTLTRSRYPGRQSVYVFTTEALGPLTEDRLTPFRKAVLDDDETLEDIRTGSSPLLNEGNYDVSPDGTVTISLLWIAVGFYGDTRLSASALDDNLFDFLRSQAVQEGNSPLSPGEIPNVVEHVENGTGFFGSLARVTYDVYIEAPPEEAEAGE